MERRSEAKEITGDLEIYRLAYDLMFCLQAKVQMDRISVVEYGHAVRYAIAGFRSPIDTTVESIPACGPDPADHSTSP